MAIPAGSAAAAAASCAGAGSSRHSPISTPNATALSALRICCERSPIRIPRQSSSPKASTRSTPATDRLPDSAGTSGSRYSVITIAPSDMAPQTEIQSVHPTTKPGYSPKPRRTITYWPPDRVIIAPGSASESVASSA